jgi:DNA-binding GntR family transcriptional regulator
LKLSRHHSLRLDGRLAASLAEHRALMQALHRQDADAAERVMRGHLLAQLAALHKIVPGSRGAGPWLRAWSTACAR